MKDKKIVLVGAGEFALIAYEYFTYDSDYEVVAFSVERDYLSDEQINGLPVVAFEDIEQQFDPAEYELFVAIPASQLNRLRTRLYTEGKSKGYRFATYISSRAFVWRNAMIGENCFIFENNTVQPFATIGNNVILWSGNHIGHRSTIQDNCFLSSHIVISGYCNIGQSCFIGVNSTFNDHVSIPQDCVIASATLVNKTLKNPERIYHGSPATELPRKSALSVKL